MRRHLTYSMADLIFLKFTWQDYEDYGADLTDGLPTYTPQDMATVIRRLLDGIPNVTDRLFKNNIPGIKYDWRIVPPICEIYDPWEFLGYMAANDNMPVMPSQCQLADFLSQEVSIC